MIYLIYKTKERASHKKKKKKKKKKRKKEKEATKTILAKITDK